MASVKPGTLVIIAGLVVICFSASLCSEMYQRRALSFVADLYSYATVFARGESLSKKRRRLQEDLEASIDKVPIRIFGPAKEGLTNDKSLPSNKEVSFSAYTKAQQRQFLKAHGESCWPSTAEEASSANVLLQRFDDFAESPFLQVELWKFCVFYTGKGNVFWDQAQIVPLITWQDLWGVAPNDDHSTALLVTPSEGSSDHASSADSWIHPSFLRIGSKYAASLSRTMLRLMLETEDILLTTNPLYTYQAMAQYVQNESSWNIWNAQCQVPSPRNPADQVLVQRHHTKSLLAKRKTKTKSRRHSRESSYETPPEFEQLPAFGLHCTIPGGYCCQVWKNNDMDYVPALMIKHPFGTSGGLSAPAKGAKISKVTDATKALLVQQYPSKPFPFWSTVTVVPTGDTAATKLETPNFFDILLQNNCLPTSAVCHACLKRYTSTTGCDDQCKNECPCYCKVLCQIRPPPKRVQAVWYVSPPLYQLPEPRVQRLIPRIVHQTWYEPLEKDKYPNMSRLQQSWKQSGWTHKFYDDATAAKFLQAHFPPAVLEAYHAIQPGAFKADLFRYCVLLVQGGVYADMDVLLESNLEEAIAPDVGFMTPMDEPGIKVGQQACLWNGFMAVAPGHPFVAKTIELVVNNIRNRFTSVDYDDMLCPNPILSAAHLWDILFTTGPCILGTAMNMVLQRHPQTGFTTGELDIWGSFAGTMGEEFSPHFHKPPQPDQSRVPPKVDPDDPRLAIPGRSIILLQNKNDMGAHRFTLEEKNLVVCSTDMPEYDDRPKKPHYAESGKQTALYGTAQLYSDFVSANEEVRVVVVGNPSNFTSNL